MESTKTPYCCDRVTRSNTKMNLLQLIKTNARKSEIHISTYDTKNVEVHTDTSDFEDKMDANVIKKTLHSHRKRSRKHKDTCLQNKLSSHSCLHFDIVNSVQLEYRKKTKVRGKEFDHDKICNDTDTYSTNCSEDDLNQTEKLVRSENDGAKRYFRKDTNLIDTRSYLITNNTPNNLYNSGNYYNNSENKRVQHGVNENIRKDHCYRVDYKGADFNNTSKSKRTGRYVNSLSVSKRKPNYICRPDNEADNYIHCEDNSTLNYCTRTENNPADDLNQKDSVQLEDHSRGENNWLENQRKSISPTKRFNHAEAIKKTKEKKSKVKMYPVCDDLDLEKGALNSCSSRWPVLIHKVMPRLSNIFGHFGNNTVSQKLSQDKCKRRCHVDDLAVLYCSKCKTVMNTKKPTHVQSIQTPYANAQNRSPFDKKKYIQYGATSILQAADVGSNPVELRCSNCSLNSSSDSEMFDEKIRRRIEKRFKKKIKKYFTQQIKKEFPTYNKLQQYSRNDVTCASIDVKPTIGSVSSHFLDSVFRNINKKYQHKQTEHIGDSGRKKQNPNTLHAHVGSPEYKDETVECCSKSDLLLLSNQHTQAGNDLNSRVNKQQHLRSPSKLDPIVDFGCSCIQRPPLQNSQQSPHAHTSCNNQPITPMRAHPQQKTGMVPNSKVECGCRKQPPGRPHQPPPSSRAPVLQGPQGSHPTIKGSPGLCDRCCQQPHDEIVKAVQKQYKGEIICIHNPPCVLINGCLTLPTDTKSHPHTTALFSTTDNVIPLPHCKPVNPRKGGMKISNICVECAKNLQSHLPGDQTSNRINRTTQHSVFNTCKPYDLFDRKSNESHENTIKINDSTQMMPIHESPPPESVQVEMSNKEHISENDTMEGMKPEKDIPKNLNIKNVAEDVSTQVRYRYNSNCCNYGSQSNSSSDYTIPQLSQGHNSELPICSMNYSDFPVIKEDASAQVIPDADVKLENFCVHVPICQKLRKCKVDKAQYDEIPTTQPYMSQTSNLDLISIAVRENASVQTILWSPDTKKPLNIYSPAKNLSKYLSNKSSLRKLQSPQKHLIPTTCDNETSTQVRGKKYDSKIRQYYEELRAIDGKKGRGKKRQLICQHHPHCVLIPECVEKQLSESMRAYEDILDCPHKRCCNLIPACLTRNSKDVKTVSSQRPSNNCRIV